MTTSTEHLVVHRLNGGSFERCAKGMSAVLQLSGGGAGDAPAAAGY